MRNHNSLRVGIHSGLDQHYFYYCSLRFSKVLLKGPTHVTVARHVYSIQVNFSEWNHRVHLPVANDMTIPVSQSRDTV